MRLSGRYSIKPLDSFRKHEKKLVACTKFFSNWQKSKARIQRTYRKIADVRTALLHKMISKDRALVAIEDPKVRYMFRSASGTVDTPNKNVRETVRSNKSSWIWVGMSPDDS